MGCRQKQEKQVLVVYVVDDESDHKDIYTSRHKVNASCHKVDAF